MSGLPLEQVLSTVDDNLDGSLDRLFDLLRIPSVSTDPAYAGDVRRAAEWVRDHLAETGFEVSIRETPGHPMVVAHHAGPGADPGNGPHLLFYGHYDVQPPDPLDEWNSGPFEPVLIDAERGKRIVARGAVDDKGQTMMFLEAFRAWTSVYGGLPVRVTVLLEGEEETGSPSLQPFLRENREELQADVAVICDTSMWDVNTPAITTMLRGLAYMEVTVHGPSHDLHSGLFGGAVLNPINVLTDVLGGLHDGDGRVQIPGFYDGIEEPSAEQLAQWRSLGFDEAAFLDGVGLKTPTGEDGRLALERLWSRPTCDINGIWGGYMGEGAKTVIAARASAKVSCRLVPGQDPDKVFAGFKQFVEDRLPPDARAEFKSYGMSPGIRIATDSPWVGAARAALGDEFDREAVLMGCGGSIPVVGSIQDILGFESILMGFGLEDDRLHSPNEKFEL
ncbi:MAG: dipeptidase, partial [Pirellulales bacterium]|nr:dipeptidase [Pirellulales bacterium]